MGVGFGYRQRARIAGEDESGLIVVGDRILDQSNPVVKVFVSRKWKPSYRARKERIPRYLLSYTSGKTGRKSIAVPVDIDSFEGVELLGTSELHMMAPQSNSTLSLGAVCCIVQAQGVFFAVTCAHVTAGQFPPRGRVLGLPRAGVVNGLIALTTDVRYPRDPRTDSSTKGYSLDVSLVRCEQSQVDELRSGVPFFSGYNGNPDNYPLSYVIRTPRGDLQAFMSGRPITSGSPVPAQQVAGIVYEQYIKSVAETEVGDSGSPVLDPDTGLFLGIHFAGNIGLSDAYMHPAWLFLNNPRYFSMPISLA